MYPCFGCLLDRKTKLANKSCVTHTEKIYESHDEIEDVCFAQNVFPDREVTYSKCTIKVVEALSYEIDYVGPQRPLVANCTPSLSYSLNYGRISGILEGKSQSVHTRGANLVLTFDSGCTWSGARFHLRMFKKKNGNYTLDHGDHILIPLSNFMVSIPMKAGLFFVNRLQMYLMEPASPHNIYDSYELTINNTCKSDDVRVNVRIMEMTAITGLKVSKVCVFEWKTL